MIVKRLVFVMFLRLQRFRLYRAVGRRVMAGRVRCRVATLADARGLARVYEGVYVRPDVQHPVQAMEDRLRDLAERGYQLVATLGTQMAGAVVLVKASEDSESDPGWWIWGLQVRLRYRGFGVGMALIQAAIRIARDEGASSVFLTVNAHNTRAVALYHRLGFRPVPDPRPFADAAAQDPSPRIVLEFLLDATSQP